MTHREAQPEPPPPELSVRQPRAGEGSVRDTLESVVIAFVLAFVFRGFVVEAFVIPTGSMAPTLLGQHVTLHCPQCGYGFVAGPDPQQQRRTADGQSIANAQQRNVDVQCPMCENPISHPTVTTDAGDRILVLKYLYAFAEPRRFDVVVFKNPEEPDVNYIKRLVGLPNEELRIVGGNIYTRPLGENDQAPDTATPWGIQRKTDRPSVQRVVWQPVYHSDYQPLDGGKPGADTARRETWTMPWVADAGFTEQRGPVWHYFPLPLGEGPGVGLSPNPGVPSNQGTSHSQPHPQPLPQREGSQSAAIRFDFASAKRYPHLLYAYNMLEYDRGLDGRHMIDEVQLAATVSPRAEGLKLTMTVGGRDIAVRAAVDGEGNTFIESSLNPVALDEADATAGDATAQPAQPAQSHWVRRTAGKVAPLPVGRGSRVELWHADQSVSLWIDGKLAAGPWKYELSEIGVDLEEVAARRRAAALPRAEITVEGSPVTLRSLDLDRDLYYTQDGQIATAQNPAVICHDEFFCLGDNSPRSKDGRMWDSPDPWVQAVHETRPGYVPREILIGRALSVYWPATHRVGWWMPLGVPNFGGMRFIR